MLDQKGKEEVEEHESPAAIFKQLFGMTPANPMNASGSDINNGWDNYSQTSGPLNPTSPLSVAANPIDVRPHTSCERSK